MEHETGNIYYTLNLIKVYCLGIKIRTLNLNFGQTQPIRVYSPHKFLVKLLLKALQFSHVTRSNLVNFFGHLDNPQQL